MTVKSPDSIESSMQDESLTLRYARLLEITADLVSTLDIETLLENIVHAAKELTDSEAASLLLHDPQTNHLYFESATTEFADGMAGTVIPAQGSIAGWVFSNRETLLVDNANNDSRFFREVDLVSSFQTHSILGVPLFTKDRTLGVIEAVNKSSGTFNDQDIQVLEFLAAQASIAIENSRLFQQSDLVAEMVHELRTPLASITAASHILQRPNLDSSQLSQLGRTIALEANRLNDLASDFLDLARLESGRVRLALEPVDLGGLVRECIELTRPLGEECNTTIKTVVDPNLTPVMGDRNLLKQLLLNLLTNAIKYNRPGGWVEITLSSENYRCLLTVQDNGRGIPEADLPHIFERFYRVQDEDSDVRGTGLGLPIALRIAKSHHGTILVQSTEGEGSTFVLDLPME